MPVIKVYLEEVENDNLRSFIKDSVSEGLPTAIQNQIESMITESILRLDQSRAGSAETENITIHVNNNEYVFKLNLIALMHFILSDFISEVEIEFVDDDEESHFNINVYEDDILDHVRDSLHDNDYYDIEVDYEFDPDDEEYDEDEYYEAYDIARLERIDEDFENFDYRNDLQYIYKTDLLEITPKVSIIDLVSLCIDGETQNEMLIKEIVIKILKDIEGLESTFDDYTISSDDSREIEDGEVFEFLLDGDSVQDILENINQNEIISKFREDIKKLCEICEIAVKVNYRISVDDENKLNILDCIQSHQKSMQSQLEQKIIEISNKKIESLKSSNTNLSFQEDIYEVSNNGIIFEVQLSDLLISNSKVISYKDKTVKISSNVINLLGNEFRVKIELDGKLPVHMYESGINSVCFENIVIEENYHYRNIYHAYLEYAETMVIISDKSLNTYEDHLNQLRKLIPKEILDQLIENWDNLIEYLKKDIKGYGSRDDGIYAYIADLLNYYLERLSKYETTYRVTSFNVRNLGHIDSEESRIILAINSNLMKVVCLSVKDPSNSYSKDLNIELINSLITTEVLYIANAFHIYGLPTYIKKLKLKSSNIFYKDSHLIRRNREMEILFYVEDVSIENVTNQFRFQGISVKASEDNLRFELPNYYAIEDISLYERFRNSIKSDFVYIDTKGKFKNTRVVNFMDNVKMLDLYINSNLIRIEEDGSAFIVYKRLDTFVKETAKISFFEMFNGIKTLDIDSRKFNENKDNYTIINNQKSTNLNESEFESNKRSPLDIEKAIQDAIGSKATLSYMNPDLCSILSNFNDKLVTGRLGYEQNINLFTSYYIHSIMCRISLRGKEHVDYTTENILLGALLDCLDAKDLNEMISTNKYSVLKQLASGSYIGSMFNTYDNNRRYIKMNEYTSCYVNYVTSILNDYFDPLALLLSHKNYLINRPNPSGLEIPAPYSTQYKPKNIVEDLKKCLSNILSGNDCENIFESIDGDSLNLQDTEEIIQLILNCEHDEISIIKNEINGYFNSSQIMSASSKRYHDLNKYIGELGDDEDSILKKRVYSRYLDTLELSFGEEVYGYQFNLAVKNVGKFGGKLGYKNSELSASTFSLYDGSNYELSFEVLYRSLVYLYQQTPILSVIYNPQDAIEKTFSLLVMGKDESGFSYTIDLESIIREPYYDNPNVQKLLNNKPVNRVIPKLDENGEQVVIDGRIVYERPIKIPYIYNSDDNPIDYGMIKNVLEFKKDDIIHHSRLKGKFRPRILLSSYFTIIDLIYNGYDQFKKRFSEVETSVLISSNSNNIEVKAVFYDQNGNKYAYKERSNILKDLGTAHRICIGDSGRDYDIQNKKDKCEVITVSVDKFVTAFLYLNKGLLREVKGSYNTVVGSSAKKRVGAYGFDFDRTDLDSALNQLNKISIKNVAIVLKSMELLEIEYLIRPFGDPRRLYPNDTDALILVSALMDAPQALKLEDQDNEDSVSESISAVSDCYRITYEEALGILNKFYEDNNIESELSVLNSLKKKSNFRSGAWK